MNNTLHLAPLTGMDMPLNFHFWTLDNPVFCCYLFWTSILVIKMLLMSLLTALQRFRNKVFPNQEDLFFKDIEVQFNDPHVERVRRLYTKHIEMFEIAALANASTCKEAIEAWKKRTNQDPSTAKHVSLEQQTPPIARIGPSLKALVKCESLNLASNMIERPTMFSTLKNLRVLNLSRNNLVTLTGIQCLSRSLEELWVSYNLISNLRPIEDMKNLKVFYASHNNVRDWQEFKRLAIPPKLVELSFLGNPLQETMTEERFRREAAKRLPNLLKLDFVPIMRADSKPKT